MKFHIIALSLLILMLASCAGPKDVIPEGNVQRLNTTGNDIPVQPPSGQDCEPCSREFGPFTPSEDFGIRSTNYFLRKMVGDKLVNNAEAITFLNDSSGFFSVSHPPDQTSALALEVPLSGTVGGTDIFEFAKKDGRYVFTNLGQGINTITWDSDPAAVMDNNCNVLLLWSSDRQSENGFSQPFNVLQKLDSAVAYKGNSDLFYAFRTNGAWSEVKNLAGAGGSINTDKNEETPFLTCMCLQPYLFFASNRTGDYDIYWARLSVDFVHQTLTVTQEPRALDKNDRTTINSNYKEYFPVVPSPLSSGDEDNYIYFSSNRFKEPVAVDATKKTQLKNVGEFDIYKFSLPKEISCLPPKITYTVHVIDSTNPGAAVLSPLVSLVPASGPGKPVSQAANPAVFTLQPGESYKAMGGSQHDRINCEKGMDRTLSHYTYRQITRLDPQIVKKDTLIEFNEIVRKSGSLTYDSIRTSFTLAQAELGRLESSPVRKIEAIAVKGDSLQVTMLELIERYEGGRFDTVRKSRKVPIEYVIDRFDTTFVRIDASSLAPSELTRRLDFVQAPNVKTDIQLEDTIYVWPQYYYYPPCEWRFVQNKVNYRRNVPYFQTGFWEVNTKANLSRQLAELRSKEFADASFIELQPKNNYFGYNREDLSAEKKVQRRNKYDNRVAEYRQFAKVVDESLDNMTDEIANSVIPSFEKLDSKGSGAQNKLIIIVHGLSDVRPIQKGVYIGDKTVRFLSASFDTVNNVFTNEVTVDIAPGASLVGEDNDILSKLRTYNGYTELLDRLKKFEPFKTYLDRGEVLLPDQVTTKAEFDRRFQEARIVFAIEGRRIDPTMYKIPGYVGEEGDFHSLDPIRRINVIVKRVEVVGNIIKNPDCCRQVSEMQDNSGEKSILIGNE